MKGAEYWLAYLRASSVRLPTSEPWRIPDSSRHVRTSRIHGLTVYLTACQSGVWTRPPYKSNFPLCCRLDMGNSDLSEPGFVARGELMGTDLTGIVELFDGYAIKTPWPGEAGLQSQADIRLEWRAY
jgi:hypothetical protein